MTNMKPTMIHSDRGSVFSVFSEEELKNMTNNSKRNVAICGRINNSGIVDVPEGATLAEIIELAGGILDKRDFKGAHVGVPPYGRFLSKEDLDKELDFDLFDNYIRAINVLSEEDCIVQYAKFYTDSVIGLMQNEGSLKDYAKVQEPLEKIWQILDRISKGRSNMRDLYILRSLAEEVKEELNQKHNIMEEIIENYYDEIKEHIEDDRCYTMQCNNLIKLTITEKCIGCGICQRVCPVDCIAGEKKEQRRIDYNRCTHCGRCLSACPVDAITAGDNTLKFIRDLSTPNKLVITQMAPAVRVAIGEAFGFEAGDNVEHKLAAGLRKLGVDYVFDTSWAADLTIMEEGNELIKRVTEGGTLPMFTSCCPAWVKFLETNFPELTDHLSSCKSPQQMAGAVFKTYGAKVNKIDAKDIYSISIMPCTCKKFECDRPEMDSSGYRDVDAVLTTRELAYLIKDAGIDFNSLEEIPFESPLGVYTGAGTIFGVTGGVMEAALRTAYEVITGEEIPSIDIPAVRGRDGFRTTEVQIGELTLKVGVVTGLKNVVPILEDLKSGKLDLHFIEVMTCPVGCVSGGGQPKLLLEEYRETAYDNRIKATYTHDANLPLRKSHTNPEITKIYSKFLKEPLGKVSHSLLHTKYCIKNK